jgi:mRNA interferase RelE/StbE
VTYRIELETRAKREFLDLPTDVRSRLSEAIDDLRGSPRPPGSKRLTARGGYRIRKGAYRILYTVDDRVRVVRIYRIGHRREVYRHL